MPTTTFTWSNAAGGDWTTSTDWSVSPYPNAASAVVLIGVAGGYTVSLAGTDPAITVGSLSIIDPSATLNITANQTDTVDGALANAGNLELSDGAALTVTGGLTNTGGIYVNSGGSGGSSLTVDGTLTTTNYMQIGDNALATTVTAQALVNTGRIDLDGGATQQVTVSIAAAAPATWSGRSTSMPTACSSLAAPPASAASPAARRSTCTELRPSSPPPALAPPPIPR